MRAAIAGRSPTLDMGHRTLIVSGRWRQLRRQHHLPRPRARPRARRRAGSRASRPPPRPPPRRATRRATCPRLNPRAHRAGRRLCLRHVVMLRRVRHPASAGSASIIRQRACACVSSGSLMCRIRLHAMLYAPTCTSTGVRLGNMTYRHAPRRCRHLSCLVLSPAPAPLQQHHPVLLRHPSLRPCRRIPHQPPRAFLRH
jgi:hypothetical protein